MSNLSKYVMWPLHFCRTHRVTSSDSVFNIFCVLFEKQARTSDRCQWAPGQGTGTQSYLHFQMLSLRQVDIT